METKLELLVRKKRGKVWHPRNQERWGGDVTGKTRSEKHWCRCPAPRSLWQPWQEQFQREVGGWTMDWINQGVAESKSKMRKLGLPSGDRGKKGCWQQWHHSWCKSAGSGGSESMNVGNDEVRGVRGQGPEQLSPWMWTSPGLWQDRAWKQGQSCKLKMEEKKWFGSSHGYFDGN